MYSVDCRIIKFVCNDHPVWKSTSKIRKTNKITDNTSKPSRTRYNSSLKEHIDLHGNKKKTMSWIYIVSLALQPNKYLSCIGNKRSTVRASICVLEYLDFCNKLIPEKIVRFIGD